GSRTKQRNTTTTTAARRPSPQFGSVIARAVPRAGASRGRTRCRQARGPRATPSSLRRDAAATAGSESHRLALASPQASAGLRAYLAVACCGRAEPAGAGTLAGGARRAAVVVVAVIGQRETPGE